MTDHGRHGTEEGLVLHCFGVRFQDVPVAVRDRIALSPDEVSAALATISVVLPAAEAVVLATCNRTELYVVEAGDPERLDLWHRTVGHRMAGPASGGDVPPELEALACPAAEAERFHLVGAEAASHLLRVACGLDSAMLGDAEILGQIRRARSLAVDAGTVGPILHRLFDLASHAGRRARRETLIGVGGAGVGPTAADAAVRAIAPGDRVVVVGAGEAANAVCRELRKRGDVDLHIVNRTREGAQALAERHRGTAHALCGLDDVLVDAASVVLAVRGEQPLLDDDLLVRLRARRPDWSPTVIDTCTPRMAVLDGVPVVHLDELAGVQHELLRIRSGAVPAAEAIVAEVGGRFATWLRDRSLRHVAIALCREAERITARAADLLDDDRQVVEVHRAVRRLVHDRLTRLRSADPADHPWKEAQP